MKLMEAISRGSTESVEKIIEKKDPGLLSTVDSNSNTALHWACLANNEIIVSLLLKAGLPINVVNKFNQTPISITLSNRNWSIYQKLQEAALGDNVSRDPIQSPIHVAVQCNDLEAIKLMLEEQAGKLDPNVINSQGQSPLHLAVINGNENIIDLLINNGAKLSLLDNAGIAPIGYAKCEQVRSILRTKAKVNLEIAIDNFEDDLSHLKLSSSASLSEPVSTLENSGSFSAFPSTTTLTSVSSCSSPLSVTGSEELAVTSSTSFSNDESSVSTSDNEGSDMSSPGRTTPENSRTVTKVKKESKFSKSQSEETFRNRSGSLPSQFYRAIFKKSKTDTTVNSKVVVNSYLIAKEEADEKAELKSMPKVLAAYKSGNLESFVRYVREGRPVTISDHKKRTLVELTDNQAQVNCLRSLEPVLVDTINKKRLDCIRKLQRIDKTLNEELVLSGLNFVEFSTVAIPGQLVSPNNSLLKPDAKKFVHIMCRFFSNVNDIFSQDNLDKIISGCCDTVKLDQVVFALSSLSKHLESKHNINQKLIILYFIKELINLNYTYGYLSSSSQEAFRLNVETLLKMFAVNYMCKDNDDSVRQSSKHAIGELENNIQQLSKFRFINIINLLLKLVNISQDLWVENENLNLIRQVLAKNPSLTNSSVEPVFLAKDKNFVDVMVNDVTLMTINFYKYFPMQDFLFYCYKKDNNPVKEHGIALHTAISRYVSADIISAKTPEERKSIHELYIEVIYKLIFKDPSCKDLPDFNGAAAIYNGLINHDIDRLELNKDNAKLEQISKIFTPVSNWKNLKEAQNKGNCFPYFGQISAMKTAVAENSDHQYLYEFMAGVNKSLLQAISLSYKQERIELTTLRQEALKFKYNPNLVDVRSLSVSYKPLSMRWKTTDDVAKTPRSTDKTKFNTLKRQQSAKLKANLKT